MTERYDVAVIGGGPAGLSAALNLVRARRRVVLIDSNRPRNSATLLSHGYLTRDGISPLELRKLGRDEFLGYEGAEHRQTLATNVVPVDGGFEISCAFRGQESSALAGTVLVTTGLSETLPEIAQLRAFYGTYVHSCIECDGYDKRDQPLALIGEHPDLVDRALLLSQWTDDLIVFTHGSDVVTSADEAALAARGITVDRRRVMSIDGDRDGMRGVVLEDGTVVPRAGGFVRPEWSAALDYVSATGADLDGDGLLVVDDHGRTSVPGLYAAGESTAPGPQQLIVAAGDGARVAAVINRDLIGGLEHLADAVQ
ncbi:MULTISPECIES: NAD(P)/FAD-dependent oxidoreductase [unclassified Frigoribacterium]|jgi:thioredoxin reductase|uniref:NAD(P)/FAD-dependent oxidoreductase n=1 Tax=unclassified Frigoribacterium TaxID=2627005 RepID=UPI0006FB2C8E|nr:MULTISPECIES: NAD(P)/FAD-dependent oxidoreductase [unclassified Frigoribacterium]KQO45412.1 pyridine nucleotide-disulfide oxidoreductase [Frigoribacterium sp. Leaf254]KQT37114.1 pyridine nucleotide-disulfide oxidoreductase [Frigoribacterium sp. Leaf415]ROS48796.1 thioredoxin reductase [Frigoribacterium sp. PhB118]